MPRWEWKLGVTPSLPLGAAADPDGELRGPLTLTEVRKH